MADEITLGEVVRRLEAVRLDCKEDTRELRTDIDAKVSMERYQLEQQARDETVRAVLERIKTIEEARAQEARQQREDAQRIADRRAADRRLIFSALIAPIIMLFLTLYLSARGAGA
jgi:division protein CdvB (Snf7/Vps24/ESCRT-III family)